MESSKFAIYDEIFGDETFKQIWHYVQNEKYTCPHLYEWMKIWRLTDSSPMGGPNHRCSERPFNNVLDTVTDQIVAGANMHSSLLGEWNEMHIRCYLYPRGTKLSWHNDHDYNGACVFYAHPQWASTWGGELMISEMPKELPPSPEPSSHLDHRWEDAVLEAYGMGTYITAKPNRMVFTSGSVWHAINRIDEDAGDHVRCAIVCFFQKIETASDSTAILNPIPVVEV